MGFFLEKTWLWLLLAAAVAVVVTWLLLRRTERAAAPTPEHPAAAPTPSRGISLRGVLGGDAADVAALRAEVEALRVKADAADMLRTDIVTLRVDADRARGLEEEVRLLRLRLEGEDGQVAVLKRRIALLEAEASRVPDLERELARAGRPPSTRTLGQVVQQAAGLADEGPAPLAVAVADPGPDLAAARAALGAPVRLDDLTVVEGIGPKIAALLADDGIATWADLAAATPERLRGILTAAGPRFQLHDPASWPEQAGLLARGAWGEFAALTRRLDGGR